MALHAPTAGQPAVPHASALNLVTAAIAVLVIALVIGLAMQGLPTITGGTTPSVSNPSMVQHRAAERAVTTPAQDGQTMVDFRMSEKLLVVPEQQALMNQALVDVRAGERSMTTPAEDALALVNFRRAEREER